ncbi:MAG: hypothetical protein AAFO07_23635, partial [Bacteroidota bacterium]
MTRILTIALAAFAVMLFQPQNLHSQCDVNGGTLTTDTGTTDITICTGDGNPDPFETILTDAQGENSAYFTTDENGNILAFPYRPPFNFERTGSGTTLLYHISFVNGVMGIKRGNNIADIDGCHALSNPITVTKLGVDGGKLSTADGDRFVTICAGDGQSDAFDVTLTDTEGSNSAWVITDDALNILALPAAPPFDLDGAGAGVCLIWHVSFEDLNGAEVGANVADLTGCFDISNFIEVTRENPVGGNLTTAGGMTEKEICAGDGESDAFDVILDGEQGSNSAWVITDDALNILALPAAPPFDLEGAGPGTCLIWHLSFEDVMGAAVGANAGDLEGCFSLSNAITVVRNQPEGGNLTTSGGMTEKTICAGDGESDAFDVILTDNVGPNTAWVITDDALNILALPAAPPFDLEEAGDGTCLIWHLSFYGDITGAEMGANAADLEGCFSLSNPITVYREGINGGDLTLMGGGTEVNICSGDGNPNAVDVTLENAEGSNMAWVQTDENGIILGFPFKPPFDLDNGEGGVTLLYNVSFEDGVMGIERGLSIFDLEGCHDLSNPLTVNRIEFTEPINGGEIALVSGGADTTICAGDGSDDLIDVTLTGNTGPNSAWVITDDALNILALPDAPPFNLEGAGPGTCLIWHLSFNDGIVGAEMGANAANLQGCFDLSNPITVVRNSAEGGEIALLSGGADTTICAGDGSDDLIDVTVTGAEGDNFAWVITDDSLNILALPDAPPFNLEGAGDGTCLIWYLAF